MTYTIEDFPIETEQPRIKVTLPPGRHHLQLVVEDSAGLMSDPDTVVITVRQVRITGITPTSSRRDTEVEVEVEAVIQGQNLDQATDVKFFYEGQEDPHVVAEIHKEGVTAEELPVTIVIKPDARLGAHSFTVIFSDDVIAQSPEGVFFKVVGEPVIRAIVPDGVILVPNKLAVTISGGNLTGVTDVTFYHRVEGEWVPDPNMIVQDIREVELGTRIHFSLDITADAESGPRHYSVTASGITVRVPLGFSVGLWLFPVTKVRGIGDTYATRLEESGITTVAEMASTEPGRLAEVLGISEERAAGFMEEARRLLEEQHPGSEHEPGPGHT
jgi:acetolactate synthase small subunit